eukprot:TRINITY_DN1168_c0_g1_i3.p1 TRINITY_DN1168_c0_g1~~TRINITY_DN1168_c0_g1_i3.p1  ORF type:complete len:559 (+),score=138.22 TRINITY_DN1168_c0_g1_i3:142-1818(+)
MSILRSAMRSLKNTVLQYDDIEVLVREATSNDPWPCPHHLMLDIANATFSYDRYPKMFNLLWKRLTDYSQIRHVMKALFLIEFLLKHGNEKFIVDVKERVDDIVRLQTYKYIEDDRDIAGDVRQKAAGLARLLNDSAKLEQLREATKQQKEKNRSSFSNAAVRQTYDDDLGNQEDGDPFSNEEEPPARKPASKPSADAARRPSSAGLKKKPAAAAKPEPEEPAPAKKAAKPKAAPVESAKSSKGVSKKAKPVEEDPFENPEVEEPPAKPQPQKAVKKAAQPAARPQAAAPAEADLFNFEAEPPAVDFLTDQPVATGDWTQAFAQAHSATAPAASSKSSAPVAASKSSSNNNATWSFDAPAEEFDVDFSEETQATEQAEKKNDDLWDLAQDLIQGNKPKPSAKPIKQGPSIKEIKQQQQSSQLPSDMFLDLNPTPAPARPKSPAVAPNQPTDAYGFPIVSNVAKPVPIMSAPPSAAPTRNSVFGAPAYYGAANPAASYGAPMGMAPVGMGMGMGMAPAGNLAPATVAPVARRPEPFAAAPVTSSPAKPASDPFAALSWQ